MSSPEPEPARDPDWDPVDEASWESFPASDPPAYGPGTGRGHGREQAEGLGEGEREGLSDALRLARLALAATVALGEHASLAAVRRSQAEAVTSLTAALREHGVEIAGGSGSGSEPDPEPGPEAAAPGTSRSAFAAEFAARERYAELAAAREHGPLVGLYTALGRRADALHLPMLAHLPQTSGDRPQTSGDGPQSSGSSTTK